MKRRKEKPFETKVVHISTYEKIIFQEKYIYTIKQLEINVLIALHHPVLLNIFLCHQKRRQIIKLCTTPSGNPALKFSGNNTKIYSLKRIVKDILRIWFKGHKL